MNLKSIKSIHFTGIKGVGLTSLALCAQDLGIKVNGSDLADEFVTDEILKKRGISYNVGFSSENILRLTTKPYTLDAVIYTAAHKGPNNPEVLAAKEKNIPVMSHAQAVGLFMQDKIGISLCGVGGKSTTSAMVATILEYANLKPSYAVGVGNIPCLGTPGKYNQAGKHFVAEADEYFASPGFDNTPKFLYQTPQIIGVTNISYDHPDVYPSFAATVSAYSRFFQKLPSNGLLVACADNPDTLTVTKTTGKKLLTYGSHPQADIQLKSYKTANGKALFTAARGNIEYDFVLQIPGKFNALNALLAFTICTELGVDPRLIIAALKTFTSTMRRFEVLGKTKSGALVVDDYAHHPSEIQATLKAAKDWFPSKHIIAVFQPHTFSRTKALFADFTKSFSNADEVILLPIYASAREAFDPDTSSSQLASEAKRHHPHITYQESAEVLLQYLEHVNKNSVILTLGAGDVYLLGKKLIKL